MIQRTQRERAVSRRTLQLASDLVDSAGGSDWRETFSRNVEQRVAAEKPHWVRAWSGVTVSRRSSSAGGLYGGIYDPQLNARHRAVVSQARSVPQEPDWLGRIDSTAAS